MSKDTIFSSPLSIENPKSERTSQHSPILIDVHLRSQQDKTSGSLSFEADLSDETQMFISEWVTQMKRAHSPSLTGTMMVQLPLSNTVLEMEARLVRVAQREASTTSLILLEDQ